MSLDGTSGDVCDFGQEFYVFGQESDDFGEDFCDVYCFGQDFRDSGSDFW